MGTSKNQADLSKVPFEDVDHSSRGGKTLRRGRIAKNVGQRKVDEG